MPRFTIFAKPIDGLRIVPHRWRDSMRLDRLEMPSALPFDDDADYRKQGEYNLRHQFEHTLVRGAIEGNAEQSCGSGATDHERRQCQAGKQPSCRQQLEQLRDA